MVEDLPPCALVLLVVLVEVGVGDTVELAVCVLAGVLVFVAGCVEVGEGVAVGVCVVLGVVGRHAPAYGKRMVYCE